MVRVGHHCRPAVLARPAPARLPPGWRPATDIRPGPCHCRALSELDTRLYRSIRVDSMSDLAEFSVKQVGAASVRQLPCLASQALYTSVMQTSVMQGDVWPVSERVGR